MALSAVESLLQKARNASQEDIDHLCKNISDLLAFPEKASECCTLLRQLFVLLQASDIEPCLSRNLVMEMLKTFSRPSSEKSGAKQCLLCSLILKELLPGSEQGTKNNCVQEILTPAVRWLCTKDLDSQRKALSFLVAVSSLHGVAYQEFAGETSEQLCSWLMSASLFQAPNPYAINPFRKDQDSQVTETDGTPCRNFFTVLNIGQYYTDDQYLNIYSFSLLYKWLYHCSRHSEDGDQQEGKESPKGKTKDSVVKRILQSLVSRSADYCFRVMDQCERKAKVASDAELQLACLTEVVTILDLVCKLDAGQVPRVHQEMRRLYNRLASDPGYSATVLRILQFFLNHSSAVVHDPQEAYNHFFGSVLSQQYKDPGLAFDTVVFMCQNLSTLCLNTNILSHFFPNILKILAWHPRTFVKEFVDLLPAMMSPTTSLEIFHTLLDLPCLTAALEVSEKSKKPDTGATNGQNTNVEPASSAEAFHTPRYKPLFSFICRSEGGQGDTINKLSNLHKVLEDVKTSARVTCCSQVVPVLLRVWFNVVLAEGDQKFVEHVLPVLLERSGLLYDIPDCKADVIMIMGEQLLQVVDKYPSIMVSQAHEIIEFIQITNNVRDRQDFYGNLVYCIGEYCSPQRSDSCGPELVAKYFDMLEIVTYEICGNVMLEEDEQGETFPKILSHLMSAMAKLATRRQDVIPRAILCLTKVAKQHFTLTQDPIAQEALLACAQEHVNLLKMPNFAVTVLNPPPEIYTGRWHRDAGSLPLILRGINRVMNSSS
ncbi:hypothetical protein BaRGS_00001108 [Batillaria attramentaria]|uniref:Uncharacterized protein n=1 Tax=Batillaria attramentaria TaxID=370345 RepID=A0ABD0M5Z2_9CAEN